MFLFSSMSNEISQFSLYLFLYVLYSSILKLEFHHRLMILCFHFFILNFLFFYSSFFCAGLNVVEWLKCLCFLIVPQVSIQKNIFFVNGGMRVSIIEEGTHCTHKKNIISLKFRWKFTIVDNVRGKELDFNSKIILSYPAAFEDVVKEKLLVFFACLHFALLLFSLLLLIFPFIKWHFGISWREF